jgi:hypothetical protein
MTVGEAKKAAKAHHGIHRPDTFGVPSDEPASHLSSRHGHIKGATFDSTAPPLQGDRVQFHLFIRAIWAAITFTLMSGGRRSHADSKHRPRRLSNLLQGGHSRCDRTSSNPFHYNATYISMCGLRGGQNNLRPALDCAAGLDAPKGAGPLRLSEALLGEAEWRIDRLLALASASVGRVWNYSEPRRII